MNPALSFSQFAPVSGQDTTGLNGPLGSYGSGSPMGASSGGFPSQTLGSM